MSNVEVTAPERALVFAALGDSTRLALVNKLGDGGTRSIASLAGGTVLTRQAITKHLRVLEKAGLVGSIKMGRESQFALRLTTITELRDYLDTVSQQWDDALLRLQAFVEK